MGHDGGRLLQPVEGDLHWLVVRTKSHQERLAADHLGQRGLEPYCPMIQEPPWHPRAPRGPVPLFSGYLFVRCRPLWHLRGVRFCPGVLGPVSFDGQIASVDDDVIASLREREAGRGYAVPVELERGIEVGRRVRLMAGPLKGLEGVFRGYLRGGERARVLMEFLRARKTVEVDGDVLALVR